MSTENKCCARSFSSTCYWKPSGFRGFPTVWCRLIKTDTIFSLRTQKDAYLNNIAAVKTPAFAKNNSWLANCFFSQATRVQQSWVKVSFNLLAFSIIEF